MKTGSSFKRLIKRMKYYKEHNMELELSLLKVSNPINYEKAAKKAKI